MKFITSALVYTALLFGANTAFADAELEALREGTMKKLMFHSAPADVSTTGFVTKDGGEKTLADYQGKYVVLNFWATWCAPCRKEMPMLSELQTEFGGDDFAVVTLATGRNSPMGISKFFGEIGVNNLPEYRDPKQAVARDMAVLGLPITVILDPNGQEIARMRGDADWNSNSAKAIIAALLNRGY
ncbi:TlpA family protein disulfide reductase [Parasulfitobacter algicola]|uniref:TlpA family protein disulfide reductase n=1 Tax=Parasulfitobacter algicola TaxID=2614809 RepID=A0ABX2IUW8_9RHOB|nr:TlpA disulfide reductase family protein [Sulfitobacter algicola]NSX53843.1 TlpA family protein disulfide reductase [Sulfitobacter algicola]